jgi:hypothetical protein
MFNKIHLRQKCSAVCAIEGKIIRFIPDGVISGAENGAEAPVVLQFVAVL